MEEKYLFKYVFIYMFLKKTLQCSKQLEICTF